MISFQELILLPSSENCIKKWHWGVAYFFFFCVDALKKEPQMSLPGLHWWCSDDCSSLSLSNSPPPSSMGTAFVFLSLPLSLSPLPSPLGTHTPTYTHRNWCEFPYLSEPVPPFKMLTCLCWRDKWMTFVSSTFSLGMSALLQAKGAWSLFCCWFVVDRYLQIAEREGEFDWHSEGFDQQGLAVEFSQVDDW